MKNFRKVLALVLVVATLLSFATMASAKDYKDQASIAGEYETAVDVLTGFGIIAGDETGNFRPNDEIDRDEVAKMVAVLCNGGEDIEAYYADACTFADTKNTWAAGYVAYCYHTGIIDGRNATTFDPNASINGYEVAKMLLCVLGFDADEQGYVGKDWKVNVLRDARNFGLLEGLGKTFNLKDNIKRQEVAQMMLTLLRTPVVVGTLSDNIIKISNALYTNMGISLKDLGAGDYVIRYGNVIVAKNTLATVYGYGYDVVYDCYGRPYDKWASLSANPSFVKDWEVIRPIAKGAALGEETTDVIHIFLNGEIVENAGKDVEVADLKTDLSRDGLVVETYYTEDGIIIAAFETDVARVAETRKWQGTQQYRVTFADTSKSTKDRWMKNTEGYAEGDILYATYCNADEDVHEKYLNLEKVMAEPYVAGVYFEKATPVKVKVTDIVSTEQVATAWRQSNTTFYAGATSYDYHEANIGGYYTNGEFKRTDLDFINEVDKTYAVYMNNGYVIAWADWKDADNTVYEYAYFEGGKDWYAIDDNKLTADGKTYTWYLNDMIDFSAKENDDVKTTEATVEGLKNFGTTGLLAQYKVADGKLVITDEATFVKKTSDLDLVRGELGSKQLTDTTKILVKIGSSYEAFTGYKALAAKYGKVLSSETMNIQYFTADGLRITHLFIQAALAEEEGYFFVIEHEQTRMSDQLPGGAKKYVSMYSAVVNGEKVKLWIDADNNELPDAPEALAKKLFELKTVYLGIKVDGQQVYYVGDDQALTLVADGRTFHEIEGDKLYWLNSAGKLQTPFHLADGVEIAVVDYDKDGKYAGAEVYASVDAFNAQWTDNEGYKVSFYTDVQDPTNVFVNYLFIVREAKAE